jgi:hypothetical protein
MPIFIGRGAPFTQSTLRRPNVVFSSDPRANADPADPNRCVFNDYSNHERSFL